MQNNCTNIYKAARLVAGYTQERAAEMLNLSVRSIADYETGVRLPPNDVVNDMVMVYNSQLLGIKHLQLSSQTARTLLPDVQNMRLPEAVLTFIDAIYDFSDDKMARELIDIARDGKIDESERLRFEKIVEKLNVISAAAMAVRCSREVEGSYL